jgi:acyl-CoA thioesterase FadM
VLRDGETTTKGETEMVCVDGRGRPRRIPEEFKSKLLACQENIATTK